MTTTHGRVAATTTTIEGPAIVWQMRHSRAETQDHHLRWLVTGGLTSGRTENFKIEPGPQAQEDQCLW
jgi:hypothetical protein